ncbi:MAG TPA: ribosome small subunit-dependent GTPase A [Lentimicrobium sp.]|nr:ribosome small subunit-dependent GTPase A [Lentimicrobium sp.]
MKTNMLPGYTDAMERFRIENLSGDLIPGRVVSAHRERYVVHTADGELDAEITGNMRFAARSAENFPAVGDWVALMVYEGGLGIIHAIFPRSSLLKRRAAGQASGIQVIAANIDYALLLQAVDRDFSPNRLERYLTLCRTAGIEPVIVLTKTDLVTPEEAELLKQRTEQRIPGIPLILLSNQTREGYAALQEYLRPGTTCCMLGSSGAGKSTLVNTLLGKDLMRTDAIGKAAGRGKHVTTHRELIALEKGAFLIDNPGMREVGIAEDGTGIESVFGNIASLSRECRFKDCTHTSETGCAVTEALERGDLDRDSYDNYLKLEKEKEHFESSAEERKRKERIFGKILKDYQKKNLKNKNNP